ncbi:hypothetical protein COU91_03965 [Candidatus Saccharibacteria bacterium CG10_big_fil_rev_8_21_14_0_10_47_8]|nr:MAG: hypothetical protein COU91_03965 [Candidatus Saccharibacteria bacterium CG10_big_fil_rev_8_21_14_0_10_47_8]
METTGWLKQTNKPVFEDLLWSRPQNRRRAGKLLIVGGHAHAFVAPAAASAAATKAGIGTTRVLLPNSLEKLTKPHFSYFQGGTLQVEFGVSTPNGSFGRQALDQLLESASWADGVLLAGDLGHNSETAILLDNFIRKFTGQITCAGDALDYFLEASSPILERENSLIIAEFSQLQKLAKLNKPELTLKNSMNLYELVQALNVWTEVIKVSVITFHQDHILVSYNARTSTTAVVDANIGRLSAFAAVWWLQQPDKPFEALTSAIWDYTKTSR